MICHPWNPKGGYVSPQVVGVCGRGWGADKGRLDIDLNADSVKKIMLEEGNYATHLNACKASN